MPHFKGHHEMVCSKECHAGCRIYPNANQCSSPSPGYLPELCEVRQKSCPDVLDEFREDQINQDVQKA